MGKIDELERYIDLCKNVIKSMNVESAKDLQDEILNIYEDEITTIKNNLDTYNFDMFSEYPQPTDYIGDVKKLSGILLNYKNNIELEENRRKEELEILRLKNIGMTIHNTNNNDNTSSSNANSSSTIYISFEKAIENMHSLPDNVLTPQDKEELENKLAALELAIQRNDKIKSSTRMDNVLKFIADKGIDVVKAILPFLTNL